MELIFEQSVAGRGCSLLPDCDVPQVAPSKLRAAPPRLPEVSENDISRHYTRLAAATHGVNNGCYPLGSCTMKYNPRIDEDVESAERRTHFENTLERLLQLGAVPVINENDTIATKEIAVGDNDTLAAIVAVSVGADLLVLLTDIDGLYTGDPRRDEGARLIPVVEELTPELFAAAGGSGTSLGTGGMCTKLQAAQMCMQSGMDMVIAKGSDPAVLYEITEGRGAGTRFKGKKE